ncbi:MAG TPA: redoxin domain-containing protein [Casimicrobiaceae bacterium]|nr:redoxin domain-containing protein [Casimicrobiaceae bacterium]
MARWILLVVAAILAAGAGVYFWSSGQSTRDASTLLALSLPDASGHQEALSQWKGKVLVVNFWATWCAPCREEMPEFVKAQGELGARGLQFVGIAVDEPDKAERFAQEIGVNYPVLIGGYGAIELSRTLGNRVVALPFTIIVDRRGRVAQTHLGPLKPSELRAIVSQLL